MPPSIEVATIGRVVRIFRPDPVWGIILTTANEEIWFHKKDCPEGMPPEYAMVQFFVVPPKRGRKLWEAVRVLMIEEDVA